MTAAGRTGHRPGAGQRPGRCGPGITLPFAGSLEVPRARMVVGPTPADHVPMVVELEELCVTCTDVVE